MWITTMTPHDRWDAYIVPQFSKIDKMVYFENKEKTNNMVN